MVKNSKTKKFVAIDSDEDPVQTALGQMCQNNKLGKEPAQCSKTKNQGKDGKMEAEVKEIGGKMN